MIKCNRPSELFFSLYGMIPLRMSFEIQCMYTNACMYTNRTLTGVKAETKTD